MAIEQPPQINIFEGAIPGQSMTASPDSKMPWDGPPQYAGVKEASEAIFLSLLEEENLMAIADLLQRQVPVSEITSVLLLTGLSKGQYNPDLLMMLIEPVMYMIMAIADKLGLPAKIYDGEDEDFDPREDMEEGEMKEIDAKSLQDVLKRGRAMPNMRENIENSEIAEKLANIDVESLLAKPEQEEEPLSLLERGN